MEKLVITLTLAIAVTGCGKNDAFAAKKAGYSKAQLVEIENRITPFSFVTVAGETGREAVVALAGEAKYAACGACHGSQGGGGVGPAVAGQTAEYIVGRLNQYKAGEKVGNQSNLMWGQAAGLSEQDINDLGEYVASL